MNLKLMTMLNPKASRLDGCGGNPEFTVQDLNYCMSGADPIGLEILRRKYGGFKTKQSFRIFLEGIDKLSKGWKVKGDSKKKIEGLANIAIYESTELPVCKRCKGQGEKLIKGKMESCSPCRGTGMYRIRDKDKSLALGIKAPSWGIWEPRYQEVKRLLDNHVHEAITHMSRRMKDE
jgi:hypothetical protein